MADVKGGTHPSKRKYESEEEEEDEDSAVFPCPNCSATFVTKMSLTRHLILHEDEQEINNSEEALIRIKSEKDLGITDSNNDTLQDETGVNFMESNMLEMILKNVTQHAMGIKSESFEAQQHTPAKVPKLQNNPRPIPNLKPLPPLIPTNEFQMAQTKNFQCELCSVFFNKKEDLARHVTRTHGGARFTCPYCKRNISRRDHLKRHIKNVHPEYCTETEIGPFLTDFNSSRTAKSNHAENFISQYGLSSVYQSDLQDDKSGGENNDVHNFQLLFQSQSQSEEQEGGQFNDEDLEEEGDDEFEGEDNSIGIDSSSDSAQQITIEPEMTQEPEEYPNAEQYNEEESGYEYDQTDHQLLSLNDLISPVNNNSSNETGNGFIKGVPGSAVERKYKCEMCDAAFMSNVNLQRHMSTHSIIRPHKCTICGKGFLRKEHLTKHLSSVHSGLKFTCKFCGKDISRKDHLLRHIRNCHPVEFMGMPPDQLQAETSSPILPSVFRNPELNGQQPVPYKPKPTVLACDICYETFNHIDELHEHQSSVHTEVWRFKCQHCPKAFKRKEHLSKHEVLHSGMKRFSCSKCGKIFTRKEAALEHIRAAHNSKPIPQAQSFPCNLCDNVFPQRVLLSQHLKSYHGVSHTSNDQGFQQQNNGIINPVKPEFRRVAVPSKGNKQNQNMNFIQNSNRKVNSASNGMPSNGTRDGGLGSLMGLINRGSLSLSRVTSTGQN